MGDGVLLAAEASEPPIARILLAIVLVVALARLLGAGMRRLGQPAVIGEILAGLLLGVSVLGQVDWQGVSMTERLFPAEAVPFLSVLANLGLIIFMFIVGMELDLTLMKGNERRALAISLTSVAIPLALGALLALQLYPRHDTVVGSGGEVLGVDRTAFILFLGASMSVTAFPLLARILTDRGMQRTPLGVIALAAAAVDDVIAWSLLALVSAVAAQSAGDADVRSLPQVLALSVLYIVLMFTVVRRLLGRLVPRYERAGRLTPDLLAFLLVGLLLSAWVTEEIGIHFIFGAFVFGACLPREGTSEMFREVLERLEQVSVLLLLPVFFIVTGLQVDVTSFERATLGELVLVLLVAISSKFGGAYLAGRLLRVPPRRAAALGLLMNTRGLTELVLLSVGVRLGVLDTQMFSMLVIMALVTTFMTTPLLRLVYPDRVLIREIAEAERAAAGQAEAYRVLVVVEDVERGRQMVDTALDVIGDESPSELLPVRLRSQRTSLEVGSGLTEELADIAAMLDETHELQRRASQRGVRVVPLTRASDDPTRDVALLVAAHDVDVVVLPERDCGLDVARLAQQVDTTVAVWQGERPSSDGAVLVAAEDALGSDAAVTLAARVALATGRRLVLVTDVGSRGPGRRVSQLLARLRRGGIDALAEPLAADARAAVAVGVRPGLLEQLPAASSLLVVGSATRVDSELDVLLRERSERQPTATVPSQPSQPSVPSQPSFTGASGPAPELSPEPVHVLDLTDPVLPVVAVDPERSGRPEQDRRDEEAR